MFHTNAKPSYDKYQAFRELEEPIDNQSDWDDDFGEFQSHLQVQNHHQQPNNSLSSLSDPLTNAERCKIVNRILVCCKQLVHKVFNLLVVNHDEIKVLEALNTMKGKDFILGELTTLAIPY